MTSKERMIRAMLNKQPDRVPVAPDMVREAARKAIDDAAYGGGFILSTGDQCGRDTPDENILALIETARTYGRY